ncbi:hypothetical protein [Streptomyces sp. PKU-EA00015]|nr:hypothetical protein [Streptomyces sp. PKU-EA00015]
MTSRTWHSGLQTTTGALTQPDAVLDRAVGVVQELDPIHPDGPGGGDLIG